ncbi:unnamed protein product [Rotaria magnacalcarata]|uniref:Uncharacterized protein n=2 Tax=Rotaria magnacalcarata TaxID=392030 RepID=A0A816Y2E4_9BILA|nr:unnamed protein product [Rotaria magnacalcarata]
MVALIGGVVGVSTAATGGVVATGATAGMISGTLVGLLNTAAIKGTTGTVVATSAAVGGAASAIFGSIAATKAGAAGSAAVGGALVASISGAGAAAAVPSAYSGVAGLASATAAGGLSGPLGWVALGAVETPSLSVYTFDCWKQILHDESCELSNGKILNEIVMDPRVKQLTIANNDDSELPHLILQNILDEQFRIEYVHLPFNQLAAHAVKM